MSKPHAFGAALLWLLLSATAATARPYTIDDMLGLEAYGEIAAQPHGNLLIVEKLGPYDSAPAYPYGPFSRRLTSHIFFRAIAGDGPLRPLFDQDAKAGYWSGGFSPSGRQLVIYRLDTDRLQIGIVDMATRQVRWLPDRPDLPLTTPDPVWLDEHRLLLVTRQDDRPPEWLDSFGSTQRELPKLWAIARDGRNPSVTAIGSGHYLGTRAYAAASTLIVIDLASNRRTTLVTGEIKEIAVSADRRLVAVGSATGDVQPGAASRIDGDTASRRLGLQLVRLADRAVIAPCPDCDLLPAPLAWSPDGHQLLFYARRPRQTWEDGQLYLAGDRPTAKALLPPTVHASLRATSGGTYHVAAAWAGATPLLYGHADTGSPDGWFRLDRMAREPARARVGALSDLVAAGARGLLTTDGKQLVHTDLLVGHASLVGSMVGRGTVTSDALRRGALKILSAPAEAVAVRAADGRHILYAVDDGRLVGPGLPDTTHGAIRAIDPGGRWALSFAADDHGVGTLRLIRPDGITVVDRINTGLAPVEPAHAMAITSGSDLARRIHWLFLPADLPAKARVPLIVIPYPDTIFGADTPPNQNPEKVQAVLGAQLLAAHGFAVLFPTMPRAAGDSEPMQPIAAQVDEAVDAAIATGRIDGTRLAVWGHSFGGYAALAVAGGSQRYRAIIASAAPTNLLADYGKLTTTTKVKLEDGVDLPNAFGWSEAGQARLGAPPWRAPERYIRNSPLFGVERIRAPILLIQGDLDYVSMLQSEQMFAALYRLDKDAVLLRYWGENHLPESPANIRDLYRRVFEFLDASLAQTRGPAPIDGHDQPCAQASSAT